MTILMVQWESWQVSRHGVIDAYETHSSLPEGNPWSGHSTPAMVEAARRLEPTLEVNGRNPEGPERALIEAADIPLSSAGRKITAIS